MPNLGDRGFRSRWYVIWYACIAVGFALLGIRNYLAGASASNVALHGIVAVGFALLAYFQIRRPKGTNQL